MLIWLMDGGAATADTGNCCATCWWEAAGQYLYDLLTCSEESIHLLLNPMRKLKSYPKWFSNMTYFFKKSNDIYWDTDNNTNITHNTTEYFIRAEVNCAAQITSTFVDCVAESTVGSSISRNSMIRESEPREPRKAWPALLSPVLLRFANGKRFFFIPAFSIILFLIGNWVKCTVHVVSYDCVPYRAMAIFLWNNASKYFLTFSSVPRWRYAAVGTSAPAHCVTRGGAVRSWRQKMLFLVLYFKCASFF